jgi:signal transduction histidine kinase
MTSITYRILSLILFLSVSASLTAANTDSLMAQLYNRFMLLYNSREYNEEFLEVAQELSNYYRSNGNTLSYYKTQLNVCLYDTDHNRPAKALQRANNMLDEMKSEDFDAYSQVYLALGTIMENCGNYRLARYYYEQSITNLNSSDAGTRVSSYLRLAFLLMLHQPVEAEYWNKRSSEESFDYPDYRQVSYFIDAMINFALGNSRNFNTAYEQYQSYHDEHLNVVDDYGMEALKIARLAFDGHYEEALDMLSHPQSSDMNNIGYTDMRIIIYKMMGRTEQALAEAYHRSEYIDSLSAEMYLTNFNEISAQAGVARAQTKATKMREYMLTVVFIMSFIIIALLTIGVVHYRRNRQNLREKNQQLHAALAMAEEGEKMKTEFVRSVSHEIRTPLNAINGFNDVLNTPGIEISEAERADILERIKLNVEAITNIVDEMLRMADKESNEFYPKSSKIYCNTFFSSVIYSYRSELSSNVDLKYTSTLLNRFQIETNEEGVRKILDHLIQNAIKFTSKGSITLHCELSEDRKKLLVSLTDTGRGISHDKRSKVFEEFYKEDIFQQGIGLGLTVSKKIASKLGGELMLDESYNDGARFVLSLPV